MQIIFGALFKRYFLIDQQKARPFVHFSEYLSDPLPFYATQLINYFQFKDLTQSQYPLSRNKKEKNNIRIAISLMQKSK